MKPNLKITKEDIQWNIPDHRTCHRYGWHGEKSYTQIKLGMGFTAWLFTNEGGFNGERAIISGSIWHGNDLITYITFRADIVPIDDLVVMFLNGLIESGKLESK